MRKLILTAVMAATLAVPAVSMADAPNGQFVFKSAATGNASAIGVESSQIKQNGQFVSGQDNAYGIDQTTTPGSRAALVQATLGH